MFLALMFIVICDACRRVSLRLHAKFPAIVEIIVLYNEAA
jgi:hypothetical protein